MTFRLFTKSKVKADWRAEIAAEIAAADRVVVLGVGNPERRDDGAGAFVAAALARRRSRLRTEAPPRTAVKIIRGAEVPESATGEIRAFGPDLVLLVDAVADENPAGTIRLVRPGEIAEEDLTTHRLPLTLLIRYIEETFGCRVAVVGLTPADTSPGKTLTTVVRRASDSLSKFLTAALFGRK